MTLDDLVMRFPDLDVTKQRPALMRVNGIGFGLYGRSGSDPETGTYVKTHCFCVLWIPLLPISAYRVADADHGWYILGRLPLSPAHRMVRGAFALLLVFLALLGCWKAFTTTDWYENRTAWSNVESALDAGDVREAAVLLGLLTRDNAALRPRAREALATLVTEVGPETDVETAWTVFDAAAKPRDAQGPVRDDLWTRASEYVRTQRATSTRSRIEALDGFEDLAPSQEAFHAVRRALVEEAVAAAPSDLWAVTQYASYLEAEGDLARCEELLAPHAASIATGEGARILGQVYAATGRLDEAFALLEPYVAGRLQSYREAEAAFDARYQEVQSDSLGRLDRGMATDDWYRRYEGASEPDQIAMIQQWVGAALDADLPLRTARNRFVETVGVVPVAIDLGIVRLQRARAMEDDIEARSELRKVEVLFEAIHGVARDDPDFLLTAARVAFWLGKPEVCHAHLEEALQASGGVFATRMAVGEVLHSLGESATACEHWKQAYESASDDEERGTAASAVAAVIGSSSADPRDVVTWYDRVPAPGPAIRAQQAAARASVALLDGDPALAEKELRAALRIYDGVPESPTSLNNSALVAQRLSGLTGDLATGEDAVRRLRKAIAAAPTDVVLMQNTAHSLFALAQARVLGDAVDLSVMDEALRASEYDDAAGRDELARRLAERAEAREAVQLLDRCMALTERNVDVVMARAAIARETRDIDALRRTLAHVRAHPPDFDAPLAQYRAAALRPPEAAGLDAALQRSRERVRALPADAPAAARAAAHVDAILTGVACAHLGAGGPVDLDDLDREVRQLVAEFPCAASLWAAKAVASARLHRLLVTEDDSYAAECASVPRQQVWPHLLVAEGLHRDPQLRARVAGTAELERVLSLLQLGMRKFPEELRATDWAMLRLGPPDVAAAAAAQRPDAVDEIADEITVLCTPFAANAALQRAWDLRRAGDVEGAEAVLRACRDHGSAVPFLR